MIRKQFCCTLLFLIAFFAFQGRGLAAEKKFVGYTRAADKPSNIFAKIKNLTKNAFSPGKAVTSPYIRAAGKPKTNGYIKDISADIAI